MTAAHDGVRSDGLVATVLDDLVSMSRVAGRPRHDLVVLAEGNTSAQLDDDAFLCTASGAQLSRVVAADFVRVSLSSMLEIVRDESHGDARASLVEACGGGARLPSIEVFVHAVCLEAAGGGFVLHTHPTDVVGLLCSSRGRELLMTGPLFPDEVVVCGEAPLWVDYAAPGIDLARRLVGEIARHRREHGDVPRVIYLANHGLITLGRTPGEAMAISAMTVKVARVRRIAAATGTPRPLDPAEVATLARRPDEIVRREQLAQSSRMSTALEIVFLDIGGPVYDDVVYARALRDAVRSLRADVDEAEFWTAYDACRERQQGFTRPIAERFGVDREAVARAAGAAWRYPAETLYTDVLPVLRRLHGRYRLGVLANQPPEARAGLERDGLLPYLDHVLLSGELGISKPDPRLFAYAEAVTGASAEQIAFVGNRLDTDVRPARRAGWRAVWILRGEAPTDPPAAVRAEASAVIETLTELEGALAHLEAGVRA